MRDETEGLFGQHEPLEVRVPVTLPVGVIVGMAVLHFLSAVIAWLLARRRGLAVRAQAAWSAATLILGAPMLVAFALIRPKPQR